MTDKELKDLVSSLAVESKKTDEQMKKTDKKLDKLLASHKKLGKMVGGMSNNQGDIAEEFFYNSLSHKPNFAGIKYDFVDKNITRKKGNIEDEYDLVMVNGKDVAIIEVKYKSHLDDVDRLLNKKYKNFKILYPEYKDYTHHLGLASFNINDDVRNKALNNNIILLQRKGDLIETILPV